MKCRIICLAALTLLASGYATATNVPAPPVSNSQASSASLSGAASKSSANSKSSSAARSNAASNATGGKSSANQRQNATGGTASAKGGSSDVRTTVTDQSTTVNAPHASATVGDSSADNAVNIGGDTYEAARIPVATAIAGGTNTTAGCRYSVGAGGQATVLGLSFGLGRKDRDCERLVLAQYLYDRGNDVAADRLMCRIRALQEALGEDCLALVHQVQVVRYEPQEDPRLTKKREFERINK